DVGIEHTHGVAGYSGKAKTALENSDFVRLEPGESYRFELSVPPTIKLVELIGEKLKYIDLAYTSNGNKFGVNAWLGVISVQPDARPDAGKPRNEDETR